MKIWKVQMNLDIYTDTEKVWFNCKQATGDYKILNDNYVQDTGEFVWITTKIPRDIRVTKSDGIIVAKMGIDHKPTQEELTKLKQNLKESIEEFLDDELEEYLENYKNMIKELYKTN